MKEKPPNQRHQFKIACTPMQVSPLTLSTLTITSNGMLQPTIKRIFSFISAYLSLSQFFAIFAA